MQHTLTSKVTKPTAGAPLRERAAALLDKIHVFAENAYGVDTRALGAFRIGLGALLLSDLYARSLHLTAHYTDAGFMPRDRLVGGWAHHLFYSFHNYGGNALSQVLLFGVAAMFALMLLVGFRTRLAAVMSWLLLTSLQGRNYLILQGGDDILRVMLFWSMFTPLAARFSVDAVLAARHKHSQPVPVRVLSIGTLALVCQLFAMYVVSAILKSGPAWHEVGHAIHLALHHHAFSSPFGLWLVQLPANVLRYGAYAVWWLELAGPFLFFVPIKTHWFRTVLALTYIVFHFGLFLSMELGHFPWVCMVCWIVVLPSWFWDKPFAKLAGVLKLDTWFEAASAKAQALIETLGKRWAPSVARGPVLAPSRRWSTALAAVLVVYAAQGTAYAAKHQGNVDGAVYEPLMMIRLNANWGMFAPNPPSDSGWFVFVAKQKNGLTIDPWRGAPVDWEKPEVPSATYKAQRWRKFLDNIINPRHAVVRPYFLRWMCNDWNQRHAESDQLTEIEFYHMVQRVRWPEKEYEPLRKEFMGRQRCPVVPAQR